ncbi:MAG: ADP-ribosylglycohydrolase family protein [Longimicrobiales bacterium]
MHSRARCRGALLGLAAGDALGVTLEFCEPGTFQPIDDMIGGGPFDLPPGCWTDDTSMALCLAESLIACNGFDARDQMQRYVRWWRDGHLSSIGRCFDIGNTVRASLARFERAGNPLAGSPAADSAGNGSIMRLAPVPVFYRDSPREAIGYAAHSSRTTHAVHEAVDACRYLAALIVGAIGGASKTELVSPYYTPVPGLWEDASLTPLIDDVARGSFRAKDPPAIRGSGYVVHSLEAALWAFDRSTSYRDGALLAVNLGDDADTTGAVYGQIAGAYYGEEAIPVEWRVRLARRELIEDFAARLCGKRLR